METDKKCKTINCNKIAIRSGYCYTCIKKYYIFKKPEDNGYIKCSVKDCLSHAYYHKKYCTRHYKQLRVYGKIFESRFDQNEVVYHKDNAEIILCNEQLTEVARTKVSLHRVPELLKYKWSLKEGTYARARDNSRGENIVMQRLIMGVIEDESIIISFKNKDTLDNRDENLVIVTHQDLARKTKISINNTSGVKGVSISKKTNKWRAYITVNNKQINLGFYEHKIDAIKARREGELKYFGFTDIKDEDILLNK